MTNVIVSNDPPMVEAVLKYSYQDYVRQCKDEEPMDANKFYDIRMTLACAWKEYYRRIENGGCISSALDDIRCIEEVIKLG